MGVLDNPPLTPQHRLDAYGFMCMPMCKLSPPSYRKTYYSRAHPPTSGHVWVCQDTSCTHAVTVDIPRACSEACLLKACMHTSPLLMLMYFKILRVQQPRAGAGQRHCLKHWRGCTHDAHVTSVKVNANTTEHTVDSVHSTPSPTVLPSSSFFMINQIALVIHIRPTP